jgi:hypothetical protein
MAEGSETYMGLAVPLFGESEIVAQTAATDILTLTGAASHSGDFLVCQNSSGTELLIVNVDGDIEATDIVASGDVQSATLTCTGIGTLDYAASNVGSRTFAVTGLTSNDVVVISPREATDGALVVDLVAAGTLTIRNVASEAANVECNYLVISKA